MAKAKTTTKIANIFGSFGYLSVIIQWLLFVAIIIFPLLQSSGVKRIFLPQQSSMPSTQTIITLPAGVQIALGVAAVVFCILVVIYAIYAIPRRIGRVGQKLTQTSAATTINRLGHTKRLSEEEKAQITFSITWSIKILLTLLPLALLLLPLDNSIGLTRSMVMIIGLIAAGFSLFWFCLQFLAVTLSHTPAKNIW